MRRMSFPVPPVVAGPSRSGMQTVRSLLPYLWPPGDRVAHLRVVAAALFLLAPKGAAGMLAIPFGLIAGYALLRIASAGFGELRDAVFAAVQQRTVRRVALRTFSHLHRLSLRFHLDRQTGGLSRAIDRGT